MMSGVYSNPEQPGRCQPVQHGWWNTQSVARGKLARWVGEYGTMPGGRITLTDKATGTVLQAWPQE